MSRHMAVVVMACLTFAGACGATSDAGSGKAPAIPPVAATPITVGAPLPRYEAVSLSGNKVMIGAATDSLTLLNVWATWCTSCREEMQDLEALHRAYAPKRVRVVAVSVDAGSETLVRRFVAHEALSFTVIHDRDARLQSMYQVTGVPSTYLIGADGRLLWQRTGGLHDAVGDARAAIETALRAPTH